MKRSGFRAVIVFCLMMIFLSFSGCGSKESEEVQDEKETVTETKKQTKKQVVKEIQEEPAEAEEIRLLRGSAEDTAMKRARTNMRSWRSRTLQIISTHMPERHTVMIWQMNLTHIRSGQSNSYRFLKSLLQTMILMNATLTYFAFPLCQI